MEYRMTMTMADVLTPLAWRRGEAARWVVDAVLVLAGSLLVALSAQVAIVLPFTPVPITGQTFAVLLVAAALGSRRGALAMIAYLAEGAAGLPVFSAGACCAPWLLGPTAGYLWSYPLVALAVGALAERGWDRSPIRAGLAMLAGNALIYVVALPWLGFFVGAGRVLETGLLPFIPGDLLKVVLAAVVLPSGWALIGAARRSTGVVDD
jgi:biotin transport system substrate-specific component